MIGMSHEQVREFCLAVGNLVRASAVWGNEKATGGDTEFAERCVHHFVDQVLQAGLCRQPASSETAQVWEM